MEVFAPVNGIIERVPADLSLPVTSIKFTGTTKDQGASFKYRARAIKDGVTYTGEGTVTIEKIKEAPKVIAVNDGPYEKYQYEVVTMSVSAGQPASFQYKIKDTTRR